MNGTSISLRHYALWFTGTALALFVVMLVMQLAFGLQLGSAFLPVLPAMTAAMVSGSRYAKTTREALPQPWTDAAAMTGVALVIVAILVAPALAASGFAVNLQALGLFAAIYAAIWFLVNRIFLGLGARNEWNAQDRRG
ncbi:MAG: ABZJ_00895 family protein [Shimia sp.]